MKKRFLIMIFCIIFFIFSCNYFENGYFCEFENITIKELKHHVKFLASDEMKGRETFSWGQYISARYIANEFEKYGLKSLDESKGYYQNIEMTYAAINSSNTFKINNKSYKEGKDFEVAAVGSNEIDRKIVFVGYGVTTYVGSGESTKSYNSYADVDVRGKIVMVFEGKIDRKGSIWGFAPLHEIRILNAIKHGAEGMIFVKGTSPKNHKMPIPSEGPILERFEQINMVSQKLGLNVGGKNQIEKVTKFPLIYVNIDVANSILYRTGKTILSLKEKIDKAGKPHSFEIEKTANIKTKVSHELKHTMNVLGLVEGRDPLLKDEIVIIGAHYDTASAGDNEAGVCKGADDNCSGTAGLLEIAQSFSECKKKPKRSVLFIAFTGEEKGVLGSGYYVKNPIIPFSKTVAMLNMDMIGRNNPNSIQVIVSDKDKNLSIINKNFSHRVGINISEPTTDIFTSTDHFHFLKAGLPVIWYFDGGGDFVHKTIDTWDKLSYEKIKKVAQLCFLTAYNLAERKIKQNKL